MPTADGSRTLDEIWEGLAATVTPALELGVTLTPATWIAKTVASAHTGEAASPPAAPPASTLDPRRHLETLAARLEDPGAVLDRLPRLSFDLAAESEQAELHAVGVLGEGGMGRVLLAEQRSLGRDLAVKTLLDASGDPTTVRALVAEGLITGQLDHPNILPVHQLGLDGRGLPALAMRRVAGVPWSHLLRGSAHPTLARFGRGASDPLDAHVEILMRVCDAVQFAHLRGIVHRDLKPDNVMVGSHGEVYVVDWGVATLVEGGELADVGGAPLVGTPVYMAPEMVAGGAVDARTDVFLLGAILHEILTGTRRHGGADLKEVLGQALAPLPVSYPETVPAELGALANRATAPRAQRVESAEAFRAALVAWRQHRGSTDLTRAATARLVELDVPATGEDPVAFARIASECRFGFSQALREWPENAVAADGLRRCLERMLLQAIADEDWGHARGLLGEMSAPSTEMQTQVQALAERLAERDEQAQRARAFAHERDLSVGATQRRNLSLIFAAVAVGISMLLLTTRGFRGASAIPPSQLVATILLLTVVWAAAMAVWGRRLFATQINRHLLAIFGVAFVGMLLNRTEGWIAGRPSVSILISDLQIIAVVTGLGGLVILRVLLGASLICALASVVCTWRPELTGAMFGVAPLCCFLILGIAIRPSSKPVGS